MPPKREFTLRLSDAHDRLLKKLSMKLGLDETNVIRLALTRLGELEGVLHSGSGKSS